MSTCGAHTKQVRRVPIASFRAYQRGQTWCIMITVQCVLWCLVYCQYPRMSASLVDVSMHTCAQSGLLQAQRTHNVSTACIFITSAAVESPQGQHVLYFFVAFGR